MALEFSKEDLIMAIQDRFGPNFISMSDLEHPTSEFMLRYFTTALQQMGIDFKKMVKSNEMKKLQSADSYKFMLQFMEVLHAVRKVYPQPKLLSGFSILSLMEPKPEDIQYVAVFDSFHQFWSSHVSTVLGPRLSSFRENQQLLKELKDHKEELQHKLNNFAAVRSKRIVELSQVEEQLQALEAQEDNLRTQSMHLEAQAAEEERVVKEIRSEVDSNREKREQQMELQEAKAECQRLKQALQEVQEKRDEQLALLADKRSVLQDKASRKRVLETILSQEEQATLGVSDYLQQAAIPETCRNSVSEYEKKLESLQKNVKAKEMRLQNMKSEAKKMENEIVSLEKKHTDLENQMNEQDRVSQRFSELNKEIASCQSKLSELRKKISENEEVFSSVDKSFEDAEYAMLLKAKSADAVYKKIAIEM